MIGTRRSGALRLDERRESLTLPGGTLRYRVSGKGPAVCLVATLGSFWNEQVRLLHNDVRVVRYDMRGFGASRNRTNTYPSTAEHGDDLACLVDRLGLGRPVVVGLSHGGLVAQEFAVRHPELAGGLVLVSTFSHANGTARAQLSLLAGLLADENVERFWQLLKTFLCSEPNWGRIMGGGDTLDRVFRRSYSCADLRAIYGAALEHDTRAKLSSFRCPTLVLGGAKDRLFPPDLLASLQAEIPTAELRFLPTAHIPPLEEPLMFHECLSEFIARCRSSRCDP